VIFVALLALLLIDWSGGRSEAVDVIGSTSIQPFAEMLAEEFNQGQRDFVVDVQGGGSTAGLQATANGVADVGMCSRALKPEEAEVFQPVVIAKDGLAVVVHQANSIEGLSKEQIRQLFAGEVTNWSAVGGQERPVRLVTREEGSGTREAFTKLVMGKSRISRKALNQESNGAVMELVRHDPLAIGFMSLGVVPPALKALKVDGVAATKEQVVAGKYPLVRPFLFVTKGPPDRNDALFIDFVLSPPGQKMLEREGLVPVR